MSLGLRESRQRRAQKRRRVLFKWLLIVLLIGGAGFFAYASGGDLAKRHIQRLEKNIARQNKELAVMAEQQRDLRVELADREKEVEGWRVRYARDVPQGALKTVIESAQERLNEGIAPERLLFLIGSASQAQTCAPSPESKRFFVSTPLFGGANDSVSFADGGLLITASGQSVLNAEGKPESWFDPAHPIKAVFTLPGGKAEFVEGKLPLHKSILISGNEYRFSLVSSGRGFVRIAGVRCDYP